MELLYFLARVIFAYFIFRLILRFIFFLSYSWAGNRKNQRGATKNNNKKDRFAGEKIIDAEFKDIE